MAITILQQPTANSFQSSDDPIQYVFSSDQTGQPNFSFIVETVYNTQVVSIDQVFPELAGGVAQWDARKVVQPLLKAQQRGPVGLFNGENLKLLGLRIFERYGTPAINQLLAVTSLCKVMKAATSEDNFRPGWLALDYTPSVKWLTNAPGSNGSTMHVARGNPVFGSILNTDPQCLVEANYFDLSGGFVVQDTSLVQPGVDKVNVHIDQALMLAALGATPLSQISRIDIALNQSETLRFVFVDESCTTGVQLNWLNNVGAVDQFLFTHNRERQLNVETSDYKKQFGRWNPTPTPGNYYTHNALDSGVTHYLKVIAEKGSIHSGWIDEQYQNWLNEIYQSVDVRAVIGSQYEKIPVTDTQATIDQNRFNDLLNFTVNYKKSNFKSITT